MHPDEFYKIHSSTAEDTACHRGKGPAGTYGAETSDCDSPYSLINATFDWIAENLRNEIDFVVWTGDSARHDSDEKLPRSPAQIQNSNQIVADKFVEVFKDPTGLGLSIPIVPTLGNNDILPHNVLLPGPNKWLKRFTDIWGAFIPNEQRHSFEFGGWFYVEVIPNHLAVFSINTLYFFDRNAGIDDCVKPSEPGFKQLEWLRIQLQFMRERGVKAILMGHVPPARTGSKQLWDETCWQKHTLWLRQYRDVIISSMYGHMNIDHFLLHDTEEINYELIGTSKAEVEGDGDDDDGDDDGSDDGGAIFDAGGEDDEPVFTVRTAMEDELDVRSSTDYLQELRTEWSKLPKPQATTSDAYATSDEVDADKKKKKKKKNKKKGPKLSHKWSERYQLSFVSPSVVPNYLPSLRVVEYNITGLEDTEVWVDGPSRVPFLPDDQPPAIPNKKKKTKKGDGSKKKDPNLTVPDQPAKTAPPGPAYSPQTLTLLGYTQYFANLTYINNDMTAAEDDDTVDSNKWHEGKHGDAEPPSKSPKPRKFEYIVEYSTFTDKIYGLSDMTVNSLLEMAYRMGQKTSGGKGGKGGKGKKEKGSGSSLVSSNDEDTEVVVADGNDNDGVVGDLDEVDEAGKKKKKEQNHVWLHFLHHAFVSSISEEKLKKTSE